MAALSGGKPRRLKKDGFVCVRKRDLEKLTTEVMQLREFLPRVLNAELMETLQRAQGPETKKEPTEQEHLRLEALHLKSRLEAVQTECQGEREEKLLLREQLWQSGEELQQQADFCSELGSAACGLLWSCSAREDTVTQWLADGKLLSFVSVSAQTLESFVKSLDEEVKDQSDDYNSHEHQFVLALVGTVTNVAAVACGRDFLCSSGQVLLETLMKLLEQMKPAFFPKLKVLMLMALYNVSININGLKVISGHKGLVRLIWTLLNGGHWEVSLHCLRLLQSLILEEYTHPHLGSSLLDPELRAHVSLLTSSAQPSLRATAQQTLQDLQSLKQCLRVLQAGEVPQTAKEEPQLTKGN
ncbi:heat shock factor 2-binding protein [Oryzias latipes]|uniref:Heat shock transcription factor 2 binding protein n=1 Tax=Oryzias latipes TaxID=8090 RepID=H2N2D2_ORYLA|nr:heat shock factor 2-binding protein [Oryzias latipes]XP_020557033.1 heat shock factor 2-binding protein [Oryzias latipes]